MCVHLIVQNWETNAAIVLFFVVRSFIQHHTASIIRVSPLAFLSRRLSVLQRNIIELQFSFYFLFSLFSKIFIFGYSLMNVCDRFTATDGSAVGAAVGAAACESHR